MIQRNWVWGWKILQQIVMDLVLHSGLETRTVYEMVLDWDRSAEMVLDWDRIA